MNNNKFQAYCRDNFKTKHNEDKYNFQFWTGDIDRNMLLMVPDDRIDEFWAKYYEYKVQAGQRSMLLERPHPEYNILKIDIDLHHTPTPEDLRAMELQHKYTHEMIKELATLYLQALSELAQIPPGAKITVFEKKMPRMKGKDGEKKMIKDGIHLVSGDIVGSNALLHAVYERFLVTPGVQEIYTKFANSESLKSMVDRKVISNTAWFPIGSGKPDDKANFYKPTVTYEIRFMEGINDPGDDLCDPCGESVDDSDEGSDNESGNNTGNKTGNKSGNKTNKIILRKCELGLDMLQSIIHFSNAHKRPTIRPHAHINLQNLAHVNTNGVVDENMPLTLIERTQILNQYKHGRYRDVIDPEYIDHLLICLDRKRCLDYQQWATIGLCLYNISPYCYHMWVQWSKSAVDKFDEDVCFRKWYIEFKNTADKYSLGIDVLKQYARSDNPAKYKELTTTHKSIFLENMIKDLNRGIGMGNRKWAMKAKEYIEIHCEWQIKCISTKQNTWYKFMTQQWQEDEGGNLLHKFLMGEFYNDIEKMYKGSEDDIGSIQREIKELERQHARDVNRNEMFSPDNDDFGANTLSRRLAAEHGAGNGHRSIEDVLAEKKEKAHTLKIKEEEAKSMFKQAGNAMSYLEKKSNRVILIADLSNEFFEPEFYKNLDTNRLVFLCLNGVLDLETCQFRKGLPKDISTLNCMYNYPYDTESEKAQIIFGEIEEFLDKIFPDLEVQNYVMNLYAEKLSGVVRREEFFIHTGSGKNGKSIFAFLLKHVFGQYFQMTDPTLFSQIRDDPDKPSPTTANIRGKHIIMSSEPKADKGLQCDTIKRLTGGDPITGRHLNKDPITFYPMCMWNMQCNDIPDMDSTDHGTWRRIHVINYPSRFVDQKSDMLNDPEKYPHHYPEDNTIKDKLEVWAPYFLVMLFNRYQDLKRDNFKCLSDEFIPNPVKEATERYKQIANVYELFAKEHTEYKPGYKQSVNDVWIEFQRYTISVNHPTKVSKKQFDAQIRRFMGRVEGNGREQSFYDWTLRNGGEPIGTPKTIAAPPTQSNTPPHTS